jgi:hypothetical protein
MSCRSALSDIDAAFGPARQDEGNAASKPCQNAVYCWDQHTRICNFGGTPAALIRQGPSSVCCRQRYCTVSLSRQLHVVAKTDCALATVRCWSRTRTAWCQLPASAPDASCWLRWSAEKLLVYERFENVSNNAVLQTSGDIAVAIVAVWKEDRSRGGCGFDP